MCSVKPILSESVRFHFDIIYSRDVTECIIWNEQTMRIGGTFKKTKNKKKICLQKVSRGIPVENAVFLILWRYMKNRGQKNENVALSDGFTAF